MENCQQVESAIAMLKPCGDVRDKGNSLNRDQCQEVSDLDDSQKLVGKSDVAVNGVKVVEMSVRKRRRGRPPRNQATVVSSSAPPPQRNNNDEEDVCFICFDGGSLVLCDRRGCPKAYHPTCIKRDEAFFNSKVKWYCGWHICSTCQKASYYMCYMCTYSLCKDCTKDADYVNVRGNKGFCGLCMRTVMLIENTALGTKEMVQVDFDDQTSWEYLFKVYWTLLKEKLSLSLDEIIKAKNPWKEIASMERPFEDLGASYSKRRKMMKQRKFLNKVESPEGTTGAGEKGHTKEYPSLLDRKEKELASPLKGGDVLSDIGSRETSIAVHSTEMELSVNKIETDKIWHYQDPLGKIQGPFPMAMLRRWSMSGHFPPGLRIWRASERQEDSTLLTDALDGRYSQVQQLFHNSCVPTEDERDGDVGESWDLNVDQVESKQVEGALNSMQNNANGHCCGNNESAKSKELGSQSSCTTPVHTVTSSTVQTGSPVPHWEPLKGDNYFPGQPRVSSLLPSSTLSAKLCETQSLQVIRGHGVENWDRGSININENLNETSEGQIIAGNVKQEDSEGKSGKSCGQSWRSPLNDASNGWDSNCGLISLARVLEAAEHNHDIDFPDLPTSISKLNHKDLEPQATKSKQSLSSSAHHQDSGPSWSTASSLVGNGPQLSEAAGEWGGYSSTPAKPSVEEWDSDLVPNSSLKQTNLGSDHAATPTSGTGQMAHSSPTDPAENASGWDSIVPEPNEYSFGDESVSDLLAEVEAMESLNGLVPPTSSLRYDRKLVYSAEPDCFCPVGGFSPAPDPGKNDALSSTNDLGMPSGSTLTNEPIGVSRSEVHDARKSSGGHSSTSADMDEDKWPNDASVNRYEAGSDMQVPAPPAAWCMAAIDTTWRAGRETTGTNWEAIQGTPIFHSGGLGQGMRSISWGNSQGTFQDNGSINSGTYWGSQQRYVSSRGPDFQAKDSSYSRDRILTHRHSNYGGPPLNGVDTFRAPPKGLRICKFYERGDCKKGAS
ncbi:hypothetical protein ES288_A10G113500v1 [Gossypium darwinii]|uniref:GYF domain-containing protein n=1 Tax=Gossypium darwinii TaxID=34276 RepID=A0A5D2EYR0_GOSDA|nr:hypothetical protein ES288_A10G113500v1 [Gossypium darwinii]